MGEVLQFLSGVAIIALLVTLTDAWGPLIDAVAVFVALAVVGGIILVAGALIAAGIS